MSSLLSQLLAELEATSLAQWECIAPLSGWPQEHNAVYKLLLRRIGTSKWWRVEDSVARVPCCVGECYSDAQNAPRLSIELLAFLRPERSPFRGGEKGALITLFERLRPRLQPIPCGPCVVPRADLLDLIAISN